MRNIKKSWRHALVICAYAAPLLSAHQTAHASQADCKDYTDATGEDRALFNGYVYGYVSAVMAGRSPTEINAITMKVVRETEKYCLLQPQDEPHKVIDLFTRAEVYKARKH